MTIPGKNIIEVIAYSGYTLNERPLSFLLNNKRLTVKYIRNRWRDQEGDYFEIVAGDGSEYLIERNRESDQWFLIRD